MISRPFIEHEIHATAHAVRRKFDMVSLNAGRSRAQMQALMGYAPPTLTLAYIRLVDEDLLSAHQEYGTVDRFIR